eukprot:7761470-Alexandrium_andersonii.AAC.1
MLVECLRGKRMAQHSSVLVVRLRGTHSTHQYLCTALLIALAPVRRCTLRGLWSASKENAWRCTHQCFWSAREARAALLRA